MLRAYENNTGKEPKRHLASTMIKWASLGCRLVQLLQINDFVSIIKQNKDKNHDYLNRYRKGPSTELAGVLTPPVNWETEVGGYGVREL